MSRSQETALAALLLILGIAASYWRVVNHEFVNFDDDVYITENPNVQGGFSAETHYNLGLILMNQRGDLENAADHPRKAVASKANYPRSAVRTSSRRANPDLVTYAFARLLPLLPYLRS